MVTPTDNPTILEEWQSYQEGRLREDESVTLQRVCLEIGAAYSCAPVTVRRWLDPSFAEKARVSNLKSKKRNYARRKKKRLHTTSYHRLIRNPARYYFKKVFDPESELPLDEITKRIRDITEGVSFYRGTIELVLNEYSQAQRTSRARGPPWLYSIGDDIYRYTDLSPPDFFEEPADD